LLLEWRRPSMSPKKIRLTANTMTAQCALKSGLNEGYVLDIINHPDGSCSVSAYPASPGEMLIDADARYRAKQLDDDWFRSRPNRSHRIRRAIVGEVLGVTRDTYIILRQLKPGHRQRLTFKAFVPLPEAEAPEHIAHAFFDALQRSATRIINNRELGELI